MILLWYLKMPISCRYPSEDFLHMIYGDMNVAAKFIRIITQNVKEKEERLINLAYSSLRKRVAKALVDIHGNSMQPGENKPIEISRDDIAQYVGAATESLDTYTQRF